MSVSRSKSPKKNTSSDFEPDFLNSSVIHLEHRDLNGFSDAYSDLVYKLEEARHTGKTLVDNNAMLSDRLAQQEIESARVSSYLHDESVHAIRKFKDLQEEMRLLQLEQEKTLREQQENFRRNLLQQEEGFMQERVDLKFIVKQAEGKRDEVLRELAEAKEKLSNLSALEIDLIEQRARTFDMRMEAHSAVQKMRDELQYSYRRQFELITKAKEEEIEDRIRFDFEAKIVALSKDSEELEDVLAASEHIKLAMAELSTKYKETENQNQSRSEELRISLEENVSLKRKLESLSNRLSVSEAALLTAKSDLANERLAHHGSVNAVTPALRPFLLRALNDETVYTLERISLDGPARLTMAPGAGKSTATEVQRSRREVARASSREGGSRGASKSGSTAAPSSARNTTQKAKGLNSNAGKAASLSGGSVTQATRRKASAHVSTTSTALAVIRTDDTAGKHDSVSLGGDLLTRLARSQEACERMQRIIHSQNADVKQARHAINQIIEQRSNAERFLIEAIDEVRISAGLRSDRPSARTTVRNGQLSVQRTSSREPSTNLTARTIGGRSSSVQPAGKGPGRQPDLNPVTSRTSRGLVTTQRGASFTPRSVSQPGNRRGLTEAPPQSSRSPNPSPMLALPAPPGTAPAAPRPPSQAPQAGGYRGRRASAPSTTVVLNTSQTSAASGPRMTLNTSGTTPRNATFAGGVMDGFLSVSQAHTNPLAPSVMSAALAIYDDRAAQKTAEEERVRQETLTARNRGIQEAIRKVPPVLPPVIPPLQLGDRLNTLAVVPGARIASGTFDNVMSGRGSNRPASSEKQRTSSQGSSRFKASRLTNRGELQEESVFAPFEPTRAVLNAQRNIGTARSIATPMAEAGLESTTLVIAPRPIAVSDMNWSEKEEVLELLMKKLNENSRIYSEEKRELGEIKRRLEETSVASQSIPHPQVEDPSETTNPFVSTANIIEDCLIEDNNEGGFFITS